MRHRSSALAFINSRSFDWLCHVADVDAHRVRHAIHEALRDGLRFKDVGRSDTPRKR